METLPKEIIEYILTDPTLSVVDIVNFSSTCSRFRNIVVLSSTAWKCKYLQRWPLNDEEVVVSNWYNDFIARNNFERKAKELLSQMCSKFHHTNINQISNSKLKFVIDFVNSHKYGYYYMRDFLLQILSLPLSQSLTDKYYGNILLRCINKKHYAEVWKKLLKLNPKEQTLEKGLIMIACWYQNCEKKIFQTITSELDQIALLVKEHLLQKHKDHPLKNTPEEMLETWKRENITDNMFAPKHCKLILESLGYVLFEELQFHVAPVFSSFRNDKWGIGVLSRQPIPIVYCCIVESVARRLGVRIEVVAFIDHCFMKWRKQYHEVERGEKIESEKKELSDFSEEEPPYYFIGMSRRHVFLSPNLFPRSSDYAVEPWTMQKIAEKIIAAQFLIAGKNSVSVRDDSELLLMINPYNMKAFDRICRLYKILNIDPSDLILKIPELKKGMKEFAGHFQTLACSLKKYQKNWERKSQRRIKTKPQHRVDEVEFAVGMIVKAEKLLQTGIICAWNKGSSDYGTEVSHKQPYYKLLMEDGLMQDLPQEDLQFCTTYYKPNKKLQEEYPEDLKALPKILKTKRRGGDSKARTAEFRTDSNNQIR